MDYTALNMPNEVCRSEIQHQKSLKNLLIYKSPEMDHLFSNDTLTETNDNFDHNTQNILTIWKKNVGRTMSLKSDNSLPELSEDTPSNASVTTNTKTSLETTELEENAQSIFEFKREECASFDSNFANSIKTKFLTLLERADKNEEVTNTFRNRNKITRINDSIISVKQNLRTSIGREGEIKSRKNTFKKPNRITGFKDSLKQNLPSSMKRNSGYNAQNLLTSWKEKLSKIMSVNSDRLPEFNEAIQSDPSVTTNTKTSLEICPSTKLNDSTQSTFDSNLGNCIKTDSLAPSCTDKKKEVSSTFKKSNTITGFNDLIISSKQKLPSSIERKDEQKSRNKVGVTGNKTRQRQIKNKRHLLAPIISKDKSTKLPRITNKQKKVKIIALNNKSADPPCVAKSHKKPETPRYYCRECLSDKRLTLSQLREHYEKDHGVSPSIMNRAFILNCISKKSRVLVYCHRCEICSTILDSKKQLNEHYTTHEDQFTCDICPLRFKRHIDYIIHSQTHSEDKLYRCTLCEVTAEKATFIKKHLKVGHDCFKNFECKTCKKKFITYAYLLQHMNLHTGAKPFQCEKCGYCFPFFAYLKKHLNNSHREHNKDNQCLICGKIYVSNKAMKQHVKFKHGTPKCFICDVCGKKCCNSDLLRAHKAFHKNSKLHRCSYCEKAFVIKRNKIEHERIHTGLRPYICPFCKKRFKQRSTMVRHSRIHPNSRIYICYSCNQKFYFKHEIIRHFKIRCRRL